MMSSFSENNTLYFDTVEEFDVGAPQSPRDSEKKRRLSLKLNLLFEI